MSDLRIERMICRAELDDSTAAVDDARRRVGGGDEDMQRWLDDHEAGDACVVSIVTTVYLRDGDGPAGEVSIPNHGIWIETSSHPALASKQIQEASTKDLPALRMALGERGLVVAVDQLAEMQVDVELAEDLRDLLVREGRAAAPRRSVAERD